jgi:hypothetical protein
MRKKKRVPRALSAENAPGVVGASDRARLRGAIDAGTLPLFDFGGLIVRVEASDDLLLYHVYGRQFPLDERRSAVIEDLPKEGAFGEIGRVWVQGQMTEGKAQGTMSWHEWPLAALGADERDLLTRVTESIRLQLLHTIDYRHALNNPGVADERRRGRDLSRVLARDVPLAKDLAANLLDTVDRLSAGREATPVATSSENAPVVGALPPRGLPSVGGKAVP